MIDKSYEMALKRAFATLHGCEAQYAETVPVIETLQGKTVWEGDVEVVLPRWSS